MLVDNFNFGFLVMMLLWEEEEGEVVVKVSLVN